MLTIPTRTVRTASAALIAISGALIGSGAYAAQPVFDFTLDNNGAVTITRPTAGTTTGSLLATFTSLSASPVTVFAGSFSIPGDAANDYLQTSFLGGSFLQTYAPFSVFHSAFAEFTVTPTTPLGLYNINSLTGTPDASLTANGLTISRNYSVTIIPSTAPAVPEPSPLAVLSLGALGLGVLVLRRKSVRA